MMGEVEHRAGLEHGSDLVEGHSMGGGGGVVFSVNGTRTIG